MENISETVNKAIDILEIFLQKDGEFSLAEISTYSKFNKATAYRLVSTLVKRGFINQPKKNGKYSLGLKALDFTFAIRKNFKFVDLAYLYLSRLSKIHNISAYISVLDADSSLVIEEVAVVDTMRINSPIGKKMPLHATACGRVLLSALSTEERTSFYRRANLKTFTCKTITNVTQLETEIENIRRDGVAYGEEEYKLGLMSIASPIQNGNGDIIAAVGIVAPLSQIDTAARHKLVINLKSCTAEISQVIGRTS
jgi:DNA-binding IclR family transcriptional regulator